MRVSLKRAPTQTHIRSQKCPNTCNSNVCVPVRVICILTLSYERASERARDSKWECGSHTEPQVSEKRGYNGIIHRETELTSFHHSIVHMFVQSINILSYMCSVCCVCRVQRNSAQRVRPERKREWERERETDDEGIGAEMMIPCNRTAIGNRFGL